MRIKNVKKVFKPALLLVVGVQLGHDLTYLFTALLLVQRFV
jgi:hypothetical protein